MSGSGTQCSMVKTGGTETGGRGEVLRNRNVGTRTRIISSSVARTRSRTPAKDCSRGTIRSKIGSARSPTPKKQGAGSKKLDRNSTVKQRQGDTRPRITRLAYSKNPIMNPIFSRLSKLNLDRIHSTSSQGSRTQQINNKKDSDSATLDLNAPKSKDEVGKSAESKEKLQEIVSAQLDDNTSMISSQSSKYLRTKNESSQIPIDVIPSKPSVEKESMTDAQELVPTTTVHTNTTPPYISSPSSRDIFSPQSSSRQFIHHALASQGAIPRSITVHTMIPHSSSIGQPTPIIRREPRDCHAVREPKYEESSPIMRHPALTQPSTSSYTEANVVTIPSDTYAACQAAFSYAAGTATEALDNVLVQLQVPPASEGGGITHVSKVVVPGPSGHGMQSTLAMLHSSGSNSSITSSLSDSGSSTESTSSATESDWDGGPKIVEEDEDMAGNGILRDPKGSRSAGLSRPSLLWGESDDDEKMRSPKEE